MWCDVSPVLIGSVRIAQYISVASIIQPNDTYCYLSIVTHVPNLINGSVHLSKQMSPKCLRIHQNYVLDQ